MQARDKNCKRSAKPLQECYNNRRNRRGRGIILAIRWFVYRMTNWHGMILVLLVLHELGPASLGAVRVLALEVCLVARSLGHFFFW